MRFFFGTQKKKKKLKNIPSPLSPSTMRRSVKLFCNVFVDADICRLRGEKVFNGISVCKEFITRGEADKISEESLYWMEHKTATEWGSYRSKNRGPLRYEMTFHGIGMKQNMNVIKSISSNDEKYVRSVFHAPRCLQIADKIQGLGLTAEGCFINSFRMNEYLYPDSGSLAHRDHSLEGTMFFILSIHDGVIHFDDPSSDSLVSVMLPARSLLQVGSPASTSWRHFIPTEAVVTHNGRKIKKDYRQSIAFFSIDKEAVHLLDDMRVGY